MSGETGTITAGFRLSKQQEYLWSLLHREEQSRFCAICAVIVEGNLESYTVRAALSECVSRHEILRTVFHRQRGMKFPFQVILDRCDPFWDESDLSKLAGETQTNAIEKLFQEERLAPFDYTQGPLLRARLAKLAPHRHLLLLNLAVLCGDAETLKGLTKEIARLLNGGPTSDEPMQYADVTEWQYSLLESRDEEGNKGRDFWSRQNESIRSAISLPLESKQRGPFTPGWLEADIAPGADGELQEAAERLRANPADLLLACWATLLWRFTGQEEPCIETLFAGRDQEEMVGAFGLLSRYLPLATHFDHNLPFSEIVAQIAAARANAAAFQSYFVPGSDKPAIGFDFSDWRQEIRAGNLRLTLWRQWVCSAEHKLRLVCARAQGRLRAGFDYNRRRYEESTIAQLTRSFEVLLAAALANLEARAGSLPLLAEKDRGQLITGWNITASEYPRSQTLHRLFEHQAAKTPERQALVAGGQALTYHELNRNANRMAHYLRALGAGPDVLVGVCIDRSTELVVSLLATLKAGGAYIPLNPEHPPARLAQHLGNVAVLITQGNFLAGISSHFSGRIVCVDRDVRLWQGQPDGNPEAEATAENLAYVIYTSGSTGVPKGVAVRHRNLVNYTHFICRILDLQKHPAGLKFASVSTIAADLGNTCIFPALTSGGCLHLVPTRVTTDSRQMAEYQQQHGIDVLKIVPSHLDALLNSQEGSAVLPAKYLITGGEALSWKLVERLRSSGCSCELINHYGPTETTVGSLTLRLADYREFDVAKGTTVPIGRPIANTQAYVLDHNGEPVPVGVAGELYIGGAGVAQGYLNQPELTVERFVNDRFCSVPEARMYKTGDLARHLPNGCIEYLGRNDDQVKVRGFRIELGEVEAALGRLPGIKHLAVLARGEDGSGDKRLVAYLVPDREKPDIDLIRKNLREQLPEYMVPSAFVVLDELPLNANGKVDRAALPASEEDKRWNLRNYVAPRTPTEEVVANICAEVLRLKEVSLQDSFFDLGGHSLLATQVISRVRQALDIELPLSALFESSHLAALAGRIEFLQLQAHAVDLPPIHPLPRNRPLPLSFSQQRLWFLDQFEPGGSSYNLPRVVRLTGPLDYEVLQRSIQEIVRRHEVFRTIFPVENGEPVQIILPSLSVPMAVTDLTAHDAGNAEVEAGRIVKDEVARPFDLSCGPLLRARVLKLADQNHVLILGTHHIVGDGWSQALLWQELTAIYDACIAGRPSPLPELPVQYADFAAWQRQFLSGESLQKQLTYWKQRLAGAPPGVDLPTDRPRPAVQRLRGARYSIVVPAILLQSLKSIGSRESATLFMTLLGAFDVLLARYSGQEDIVLGTTIAGRNRAETERLIGFFVNTLVLRSDLSGAPTFRQLLVRMRETAMGAYAHQDLPFEKLVEELNPVRDLSRSPLFQVMLMLQIAPEGKASFRDITIGAFPIPRNTAKFDLTFSLTEVAAGLRTTIEYNTDLFEAGTIERMGRHWQTLLEGIVADPDQTVSRLPLLEETEQRQLLVEWNGNGVERITSSDVVHERFAGQAEYRPHAVAVACEDRQLSYGELNRRANQLAHNLRRKGIGPDTLVGIYMHRDLETVIAILGILKAGGAYLPLEPAYPSERLQFMLEDAQPAVLLTVEAMRKDLPPCAAEVVCLDTEWERIAAEDSSNPLATATPENLVYVIYTSGSTGRPKGTLITHRNVARLFEATQPWYGFGPKDVWTLFHSFAFDFSVWELWGALLYGGKVVVVPYLISRSPEEFYQLLAREKVTVLNQTPSSFQQMIQVEEGGGAADLELRYVIFGGEALEMRNLKPWFARHGDQRPQLVNMYGITETTVHVTYRPLRRGDTEAGSVIGRPIPDLRLYILDGHLQPVPVGVAGEMYVGGGGVARGYLNRPELTAERFLKNPFENSASQLYRTGDRARWLATGDVEYLGRVDDQVKIRGFRIELGEIEAQIGDYPGVGQTVVLVREDVPGDKRLVAYFVAEEGVAVQTESLRNFLRERLPDYMVPAAFVFLPELPLTANGKVDRKTLPAPDYAAQASHTFVAPRTPTEEILAQIWAEKLGLHRAGIYDNFFDSGGHSLLATQVISELRRVFGVEVPLRAFFEQPTVAEIAQRVQSLQRSGPDFLISVIEPASRDTSLPLSFAQQRLWFLNQFEPGSPLYNVPRILRLSGSLNLDVLDKSMNEIVRRHEVLRTVFSVSDGEPTQVIIPDLKIPIMVTNLSHLPEGDRDAAAYRLAAAEARTPFDLSCAPLLRVRVLQLAEQDFVLVLNFHHIVSDGWSTGLVTRELAALYEARIFDYEPQLPELPVQYADFAVWQRTFLSEETLSGQLAYWKRQLAGAPANLDLPTDHPRPPVRSFQGAQHTAILPNSLLESLKGLAREEHVTLFMTLLAAFDLLLSRYSGQEDIVVGSPIAGRKHAEIENLIGFFVNTLVLRTDLSGNPSFRQLLARARRTALEAYSHQDLPFEKLVEELNPARDTSRSPLFQTMLVLQNAPDAGEVKIAGLAVSGFSASTQTAKFDFTLMLTEKPGGLSAVFEYSTDLFDGSTVERIARHWQTLLESIVTAPGWPIERFSLLDGREREILEGWSAGAAPVYPQTAIHRLFEAQAEKTPAAIAVVFGDTQVSYAELNRRANRIAHALHRLGVKPGSRVGISLERSPEMIAGLLGILKAGGAYLPLDRSYPQQRLAFMIEDADIDVLLTTAAIEPLLPQHAAQVVRLEELAQAKQGSEDENLPGSLTLDDLAYVTYTSGSTGIPKGVEIPHRGVVRLLFGGGFAQLDPTQSLLQFAPVAFDASTLEIWGPLLHGGKCVLFDGDAPTAHQLGAVLRSQGVTTAWLTASLFNSIVDEAPQELASLRQLLVGGEALSVPHIRRALAQLPATQLINGYGPTESTTFTCTYAIPRTLEGNLASIPIGRPIGNTQVYLLDRNLSPVPIGVAGELYIGGDGLARGYLQRPELTGERFVPHPFSGQPGARLYRTGDLCRWLSDGNIEYLGRLDNQVKIRGFRIELGEVEAQLARYPGVRQVVALVREDQPGDRRLVAYVVADEGASLATEELGAFLKQHLPDYMVPAAFVTVPEMPLTAHGKVDRKALPAPEYTGGQEYVAPRTPQEEVLAEIWAGVLHVNVVGRENNFFELGGHSLLATQVVSRIRDAFKVELPLLAFFEAPTVAKLSSRLVALQRQQRGIELSPVRRVSRSESLPLSFAQRRLWFLDQLEPGSPTYNVPRIVRLAGALNTGALERALQEIARRHEALRTTFRMESDGPVQVIHPSLAVPLEVTDLTHLRQQERESEARRLCLQEVRAPFDLSAGPLLRARLLKLGASDHVFIVTAHHIASDGWSQGLLAQELSILYDAYLAGRSSPLAELTIQYADFAAWQHDFLSAGMLDQQMAHWKRQLAGAPASLDLPTDRPRPPAQTFEGGVHTLLLPKSVLDGLKALGRTERVTLFMTLLAAFDVLLSRYSGQEDIVVGSPIAGRNRSETEKLIGFFVNTLVLRTDLSSAPSFRELLARVRETAMGAYAHQDLPFEKLVEELNPVRDMSRNPIFQVAMVLQNIPGVGAHMGDLQLMGFEVPGQTSKFDLSLGIRETDDGLAAESEYNTDLFDPATIERMGRHWQTLLEGVLADPDRKISELPLLKAEERHQILAGWNRTARSYPCALLQHLIEAEVEKTPLAPALVFQETSLTYEELNSRANQLAHFLRKLGVGREALVAVCMQRSLEMVIALLGVLKAGGAYVPLDPEYPSERLATMLEDARPALILAQQRLLGRLPESSVPKLCLDSEWERVAGESTANPEPINGLDDAAYVIYTSGSTGKPKGVVNIQSGIVNRLLWAQETMPLGPGDRFLQKTPYSFDVSVTEFFWPLLAGACLVMAVPDGHKDPAYLVETIRRYEITTIHFVPSMLQVFLEAEGAGQCVSLQRVLCSGEALSYELQEQFFARFGEKLHNLYGPTEAAVDVSYWKCGSESGLKLVPIGHPVANTQLYILDRNLQPVPAGVAGELHIGGVQLARGYLNRPELTAERFIPDPFLGQQREAQPASRLYKTGDLTRFLPDGTIQYLGRIDHQVKLRGFRIELGEIEAQIGDYPGVRQAVVIVREDVPGDKRLVAYLMAEPTGSVSPGELRGFLSRRLPEYMLPAAFVVLAELPLSPNGKVDRKALPAPDYSGLSSTGRFVAPQNPTQEVIAGIWAEVLRMERVGVEDNFFELGGHSLLATQVVSRIRQAFSVELSLRSLFAGPTIAELADTIQKLEEDHGKRSQPDTIVAASREAYRIAKARQK